MLDAVGNRVQRNSTIAALASKVNTFNSKDQLDTDGYDANGNTLAADGKTFTYTYDNRLKTVNGGAITLGYDGNNNRVTKTVGAVTTNYLVDELSPSGYAQVVEEQVGGQVNKAYVWGHMLISQRQLLAGNWVTHYYGQDGSENVRQLFDNTGTITDTFDYDAFGILIGRTGTTANSYLYRSQQFDADLGFYYNRARYYDQTRGRFLSRDEFDGNLNEPRSINRYLYSLGDSINRLDSSGYASLAHQQIVLAHEAKAFDEMQELAQADACEIFKLASVIGPSVGNFIRLTYCAIKFDDPDYLEYEAYWHGNPRWWWDWDESGGDCDDDVEVEDEDYEYPYPGPYANLIDHPSVGPGKAFTTHQKLEIYKENMRRNAEVRTHCVKECVRPS